MISCAVTAPKRTLINDTEEKKIQFTKKCEDGNLDRWGTKLWFDGKYFMCELHNIFQSLKVSKFLFQ